MTVEVGRYRILGWAYVVMLITFIVLKGKNYYLAPAYPILFAAGAIAFERITSTSRLVQSHSRSPLPGCPRFLRLVPLGLRLG